MYELAYAESLVAVAMGVPRDETRQALKGMYPALTSATAARAMDDALTDALKQGVEREDVDPSWARRGDGLDGR